METPIKEQLKIFNRIYKEMDTVYHNYAKSFGLSDAAFWILYSISEHDCSFTQRELCSDWFFMPQTVNSALKDLEKRNIIMLEPVPGNKKNKWIKLTDNGTLIVERVIFPLMRMESESFSVLPEDECNMMLSATQKYMSFLKGKLADMTPKC